MRNRNLIISLVFSYLILGTGRLSAQGTWAVVAPADLDARVALELKVLAEQNSAKIRDFPSAEEASRQPARLVIELRGEKVFDSFIQALRQEMDSSTPEPTPDLAREGYILEAAYPASSVLRHLKVTAATASGFHYALLRLPELLHARPSKLQAELAPAAKHIALNRSRRSISVTVVDYPSFPERGIVEGFYGTPWSHQDRLEVLRFEGQHGMNVYYYAPKDDPYHRKLWQEPYPPAEMKRLEDLAGAARANFVNFCFAISPGLSMVYSSDDDFAKLTAKLDSVGKLGVNRFALFLDDVPPELQHPEDRARFKTLAEAHVYVINKLNAYLKSQSAENRLIVTPTVYTNEWGSRDYIRELGAGADPDVALVWTGPRVVSPAITVAQAREWGELLHRPPLIWDNFPVNDGIPWRPNLGPLTGRDPDLPSAVAGLFSNPMSQAHASLIPLQTIADYLWNSRAYNAVSSHRRALIEQYGKDAPRLLARFLKTYGDYWWDENIFRPLFVEERRTIDLREIERRVPPLEGSLKLMRRRPRFRRLLPDLRRFPSETRERLAALRADQAFRHLPGQKLRWREDYDALSARRVSVSTLDGDFSKWQSGPIYTLDKSSQIVAGAKAWKGPQQFSARVALGWDENFLYVGVDVTDPELYQPFSGRGIDKGDAMILTFETAFRKNFESTQANGDEYRLFFSPGNFAGVESSVFSDEDYLPPRPQPRDYNQDLKTAWKKTASGYSGDIAIPVSYFDGGRFQDGYEIGLSFGAQKFIPPTNPPGTEEGQRIALTSKADRLFPVRVSNPSTYQRLVLVGQP